MRVMKLLAAMYSVLAAGVALASPGFPGFGRGPGGGFFEAPEPVTLVGVAVGACAVGIAAYRRRRK